MALVIGVLLALSVGLFCTAVGLDRDRALYPVVTIVVASYYALYAVMGGSTQALMLELLAGAGFLVAAAVGFKWSLWLVAAALIGHGAFDFIHAAVIANPGVPAWWPAFCGGYDVMAGVYLAGLLKMRHVPAVAS